MDEMIWKIIPVVNFKKLELDAFNVPKHWGEKNKSKNRRHKELDKMQKNFEISITSPWGDFFFFFLPPTNQSV